MDNQFKRMQQLAGIITEGDQTYDYGCAMLYFVFPQISKIHKLINKDDIFTKEGDRSFGLEDEPHCTLLYGLHSEVSTNDVKKVLDKYKFAPLKAYNVSKFDNPEYDVLKFDIKGDNLYKVNTDLKQFPFTSDFPDYHPHMTIGYLKKGKGNKYIKMFKGLEYELLPQYAVYSNPNGDKDNIKIKTNK